MPAQAHVESVAAVEAFRARPLAHPAYPPPAVEEAAAEVARLRQWLDHGQRHFWEGEIRKRRRALEAAQQELFSSRLSKLEAATAAQQMALHRAEAAVRAAEAGLATVRRWSRDFESRVAPLARQVEPLHSLLTVDLANAAAALARVVEQLEAYADVRPDAPATAPPPVATSETRNPGPATSSA
ncbi:MAG TPA: hypothetical protein PKE47_05445 [Verrucomicrobiota bacterium]|nr:hypothetical protein [Verrucomicrobiota bacterium]